MAGQRGKPRSRQRWGGGYDAESPIIEDSRRWGRVSGSAAKLDVGDRPTCNQTHSISMLIPRDGARLKQVEVYPRGDRVAGVAGGNDEPGERFVEPPFQCPDSTRQSQQLIIAPRCDNARLDAMAPTSTEIEGTSHAASLARSAREKLASALAELQAEGVPPDLVDNAAGVARAMGLLLQYEKSGKPNLTEAALGAVREALGTLQGLPTKHNAVERATGLVAASLGLIHSVGELAQLHGEAATSSRRPETPAPANSKRSPDDTDTVRLGRRARAAAEAARVAPVEPPAWLRDDAPANDQHVKPKPDKRPQNKKEKAAKRKRGSAEPKPQAEGSRQGGNSAAKRKKGDGNDVVEAALGAHSATNFYRGLSGGDVIESGGLFIATYEVRKIGDDISLIVSLPGGYEFHARGTVRWSRDIPRSASMNPDAPPGFGVKFTEIPEAARQLVERYVRNRDPLLHDD